MIGRVSKTAAENYEKIVRKSQSAFIEWRKWPAPRRGKVIHDYGRLLRLQQQHLGRLVSYEMGKSLQEGLGEVQEMIDICDFSVGLSRQLYGLTMHSERPEHRMYEQWHPFRLGRHHQRFQLSRCGMVLECHDRLGLRQCLSLEAI